MSPFCTVRVSFAAVSAMSGTSSRTSEIRFADAIARDICTNIIVTIIKEDRICVMYVTNAERSPTDIVSATTILPPNHRTAMVVMFIKKLMTGDIKIMTPAAAIPLFFSSALDRANLSRSNDSRTKDLTTRTLVRFSCTVAFSPSILVCIAAKRGKPREMISAMAQIKSGMTTASTSDRRRLIDSAMISAPIIMPGERRHMRSSVMMKFCIWVTSLVRRVISDEVENLSMLANE